MQMHSHKRTCLVYAGFLYSLRFAQNRSAGERRSGMAVWEPNDEESSDCVTGQLFSR